MVSWNLRSFGLVLWFLGIWFWYLEVFDLFGFGISSDDWLESGVVVLVS